MTSFKTLLPFYCLLTSTLICCNKTFTESVEPENKNRALWKKFGGTYKLDTVFADRAVDIDLDGVKNMDMTKESGNFRNNFVLLKISSKKMWFEEMWAEQYPSFYDGKILHVNFASQGGDRTFEFQDNYTRIVPTDTVTRILNGKVRKTPPTSIRISDDKKIEVKNTKKLYTSNGLEDINFTSVYSYKGYNKGEFR